MFSVKLRKWYMNKRKNYTAGEKAMVALEAIKEQMTMAEIASKYTVHPTQIKSWKKKALDALMGTFTKRHKREKAEYERMLSELYEQIGRLKVEVEFLKKKHALFTEE